MNENEVYELLQTGNLTITLTCCVFHRLRCIAMAF